jgi:hypothetical protein
MIREMLVEETGGRALAAGGLGAIVSRPGWRRLNLSVHADWLAYQECEGGAIEIWKYPDAELLHRFYMPEEVTYAEFRPNGGQLACLCGRDVADVWCWNGNWKIQKLGDSKHVFSFLSYSGDSRFLAAVGHDRTIHIWDAQTLERVAVLPPQDAVSGLSLNEDGSWLATGSGEEVRIFSSSGGLVRSFPTGETVWRTCFSPKGNLLSVVHENAVQFWGARTGIHLGAFPFPVEREHFQVAFRLDGAVAAWGNATRGGAGPLRNPPLGFYGVKTGGVITTVGEAVIAVNTLLEGKMEPVFIDGVID